MINFRVADLEAMLEQVAAAGAKVFEERETSEFGSFGWFLDPEGNKVELWQPPQEDPA
jgi:predicted enzyme related to lactoylglutathione lyase